MSIEYTYAPMAKTADGNTLFLQNNTNSVSEAEIAFTTWADHYHYKITEAWIDVFSGDKKVNTIRYERRWVPEVKSRYEEPYPEFLGKTLRQIMTERLPSAIDETANGGIRGCPNDYAPFTEAYTCIYRSGNCTECWNQIYEGKQKRGK